MKLRNSCQTRSLLILFSFVLYGSVVMIGEGNTVMRGRYENVNGFLPGTINRDWSTPGNIYYVSPSGNDNNPGSENLPWRTISKAASALVNGETVYIKTGNYHERLVPENSGGVGNEIRFLAYPGSTVTLDGIGISIMEEEGLVDLSGKSFIIVSGIRVVNSNGAGFYADNAGHIGIYQNYTYNTVSSGIGFWNSSFIIVDGNEVVLACNDGSQEDITIAGTSNFEVKNNQMHTGSPGTNGGEGIDVKDGSHDGKVYRNRVHNLSRIGLYVDAWDKHTYNIEVFQNLVYENTAYGIALASEAGGLLENINVYNNVVYNNTYCGIGIAGWGYDLIHHPMNSIKLINNTFYNNGAGVENWGPGISVENPEALNIIIRNNIASENAVSQIRAEPGVSLGNLTVDHNLIYGDQSEDEILGTDYVVADPQFINPLGNNYSLLKTSPAIEHGSAMEAPTFDFAGIYRPQDGDQDGNSQWDIGAYEFLIPPVWVFLPLLIR